MDSKFSNVENDTSELVDTSLFVFVFDVIAVLTVVLEAGPFSRSRRESRQRNASNARLRVEPNSLVETFDVVDLADRNGANHRSAP